MNASGSIGGGATPPRNGHYPPDGSATGGHFLDYLDRRDDLIAELEAKLHAANREIDELKAKRPLDPERSPPSNNAAEQELLGTMLCDNATYLQVSGFLQAKHFNYAVYGRIFAAIAKLIELNQVANPVTLKHFFHQDGALTEIGGAQYLATLAGVAPTTINAEHYGRDIYDLAVRRAAIPEAETLIEALYTPKPGVSVGDVWSISRAKIDELTRDAPGGLDVHDAGDIVISEIQPRRWMLGVSFCRQFIGGLTGSGGGGKTAVRYPQYLALATGRDLTGEHVHERCRVLIVCLEDNLEEVKRRIGAAMLHHKVDPAEVKGWLYYCTPKSLKLLQTENGARVRGRLYAELRAAIRRWRIDLVSLDPFVKAHGVDENDNNAIDEVCTVCSDLMEEFDCAFDLVSHARKGQAEPGDADRDRGASAKRDAGRLMRTLTAMSAAEAERYGVSTQDRAGLIRIDDAKVNLTAHSPDAMWFQVVGVALGNGDNVQTAKRWYPTLAPPLGLSIAICNEIVAKIDAGTAGGRRYTASKNAKMRAAFRVVLSHCPEMVEQTAVALVESWVKNRVLDERLYHDPIDRKEVLGLFATNKKLGARVGN